MPVLGQGTWKVGTDPRLREREAAALRLGLDLGMTLIDTAEMYGDGAAERTVALAIEGRREEVFLVTKVLPGNASETGTILAAERSLRRLRTDRIDLYLLHWESEHPLAGTLAAFERLREAGKILHYGLSNFDTEAMDRAESLPGGAGVAADQVYFNLRRRGIERKLLPWCSGRGVVVMAYSPLDEGRLTREGDGRAAINKVARRHGVAPATVCVAWTLRHDAVVSLPKATNPDHVRANAAAAALTLTGEDLNDLDAAFPAPSRDIPLETV
jgi:diketogulonate reductase-like aldo/keto reductase